MDDAVRRHRTLTCSHAVFELAKAVLSSTVDKLTLDIPKAVGHKLQHLSRDHDPKIAFAAMRTTAVMERALLHQLSTDADADANVDSDADVDSVGKTDPERRGTTETADVLAATIGENDPTSPRYSAGPRIGDRPNGPLIAVTEFTSSVLGLLLRRSWHPTRQEIEDVKSTFEDLCRGLNGRDFSPATQERFVDVLSDVWKEHVAVVSSGERSSTDTHHWAIIVSLRPFVATLDTKFFELLKQRGYTMS